MWCVSLYLFSSCCDSHFDCLYHEKNPFLPQVAQTRIQFNEKQLLQLIHQHLLSKNLTESASVLLKEAGLPPLPVKQIGTVFPPYRTSSNSSGSTPVTPGRPGRVANLAATAAAVASSSSPVASTSATPIPSTSTALTPNGQAALKFNLATRYVYSRLTSMLFPLLMTRYRLEIGGPIG